MSSQLGPPLIGLFAARAPLRYLPACDTAPENRKTPAITGIAEFLPYVGQHDQEYTPTETFEEAKVRRRQEKKERHERTVKDGVEEYNPNEDTQVRGDPYKTLFVSRLSYEVTEDDLKREFERYGVIERVRLVCSTTDQKPKGYAFLVFERGKDMKAAYKDADGIKIKDRRVLVDVERGRTVKGWRPMRLGGGLGGRHYTKPTRRIDVHNGRVPPAMQYSERGVQPARTSLHQGQQQGPRDDYRNGPRPDRDRGDRDRDRDRDRGDRGGRGSSSSGRNFPPSDRYGGHSDPSSRSYQSRQGIGFDRAPDPRSNGPPVRSYQDNHIGFAPAVASAASAPSSGHSAPLPPASSSSSSRHHNTNPNNQLDPRARQPPQPYSTTSATSTPTAPTAPWLKSASASASAPTLTTSHHAGSRERDPRDRSHDRYDDRDSKRRRY